LNHAEPRRCTAAERLAMFGFIAQLFTTSKTNTKPVFSRPRLALEALEDRCVPAFGILSSAQVGKLRLAETIASNAA
jgi:hypothetical protein